MEALAFSGAGPEMRDAMLYLAGHSHGSCQLAWPRPIQLFTRGETGRPMLLGAESCAPDIGLTRGKVQRCSGPMEEINSAALAAKPSQHASRWVVTKEFTCITLGPLYYYQKRVF